MDTVHGAFPGRFLYGGFNPFQPKAQGLSIASWNGFKRIAVIHTWGAAAWPETGGKQTVSTEGHLALLTDAPLEKKNKARKRHCQRVFSTSSVAKSNLMFVIYNPPSVRDSDFMPVGENESSA